MPKEILGKIHSIQTMGALDGPGIRFVAFLQGCPLRCKCCHNPDTWNFNGGQEYSAESLLTRALRYREYFGNDGGVTVSGGEPLLQAEFVAEFFKACKDSGINTCLDTSGCVLNDQVKKLLEVTDRVLLDIKYVTDKAYVDNVGCSINAPLAFLEYLNEQRIPTTLRQVIIPTVNDQEESVLALKKIAFSHPCVDKIELLPFKKFCLTKYEDMGIPFPFINIPEPTLEQMTKLETLLENYK